MALKPVPTLAWVQTKKRLTDEQRGVVASDAKRIVVDARAGSGKTSTLRAYTVARPNRRFLYVAFNKALQLEAERTFGPNTVCRTTHALAFPEFGQRYKHKLGNVRPIDLARKFGVTYGFAREGIETVNAYLASGSRELSDVHIPDAALRRFPAGALLDLARRTWADMQDLRGELSMPHDGYLKLYGLSRPDLSRRFDTILFDEAQDANPVTAQIVKAQTRCQLVMVGDHYQSIFAFRGARDAMKEMPADAERHYLTKSFRFGAPIAQIATRLLQTLRNEPRPIEGLGACQDSRFEVDESKPFALLCRTNGAIFENAVEFVTTKTPVLLVGGIQHYAFEQIVECYLLYARRREEMRDSFLKKFESYADMSEYAKETEDRQLGSMIKAVDKYRDAIPTLYKRLKREVLPDDEHGRARAHASLITAHRAKGLQWPQVRLENDFPELVDGNGVLKPCDTTEAEQEVNLLYVGTTRAEEALELNDSMIDFLAASTPAMKALLRY